jgi:hypothetical protein
VVVPSQSQHGLLISSPFDHPWRRILFLDVGTQKRNLILELSVGLGEQRRSKITEPAFRKQRKELLLVPFARAPQQIAARPCVQVRNHNSKRSPSGASGIQDVRGSSLSPVNEFPHLGEALVACNTRHRHRIWLEDKPHALFQSALNVVLLHFMLSWFQGCGSAGGLMPRPLAKA